MQHVSVAKKWGVWELADSAACECGEEVGLADSAACECGEEVGTGGQCSM